MAETNKRRAYQASYRDTLEDPVTPLDTDTSTVETDPATPDEITWKKRYGDLRSHNNSLTERVNALESQLRAANKQEIKIPSTPQELDQFARTYPDVYRHISSIVLTNLLHERQNIAQETQVVREDLEKVKRERGIQKIYAAHSDFDELNLSDDFHTWARKQPKAIQDWLFEESDPDLCIRAIDMYKLEKGAKTPKQPRPRPAADALVRTSTSADLVDDGGKKIWKASEIAKMHPKMFEQHESEIEAARREGRLDANA